jgi:excisionase family DNA binding protein
MSTTEEFLNVRDSAKRLGVHENTVRNLEQRGELRAVRLPGSGFRRFLKEDIERMRREMFEQFAPPVEIPKEQRRPSKRRTATPADYSG